MRGGRSALASIIASAATRSAWPENPRQTRVDQQARAVLHERVAHKGEACLHTRPLAIEPRIGIRGRGMCFVGTLLAPEVHFGVAATIVWRSMAQITPRRSWLPSA